RGGEYHAEARAQRIDRDGEGYVVETAAGRVHGAKVVLAAGLGNRPLGGMVGLTIPVKPQKGQILVSERSRQLLSMPTHVVRQSDEGTFMMGDSHEDAGFNTFSGSSVMADIARNAMRTFPFLRNLRVVRTWAAVRVMSEDGGSMLKRIDAKDGASVAFTFEGRPLTAMKGDSVASALLAAGEEVFRSSPVSDVDRGPFCMMGVCFDCLVEIDGAPNRQACMTPVSEGMKVRRQRGAVEVDLS
ncbi:hypothetical protein COL154_013925, partial [Colletotrichum chrysophilum]